MELPEPLPEPLEIAREFDRRSANFARDVQAFSDLVVSWH